MKGVIEGRMVHYVLPSGGHRAALIVKKQNENGCCNLQVFTDGMNDGPKYEKGFVRVSSVNYSESPTPNTWHWIEEA